MGIASWNNEVEMFLGKLKPPFLQILAPPVGDLRWEKPVPWIPELNKKIIANEFKPSEIALYFQMGLLLY